MTTPGFGFRSAVEPMIAAFERCVAARTDEAAIVTKNRTTSYRELASMANAIAGTLGASAGGAGPVGVLVREIPKCIATILGATKSGRIFMSLELDLPEARLAAIVESSGADTIVTDTASMAPVIRAVPKNVRVIDVEGALSSGGVFSGLDTARSTDAPELIIYTSGSTGAPKGVVHGQRYMPHFAEAWTGCVGLRASERVSVLYGCGVSAGLNRSLSTLLAGGCLCPFDVKRNGLEGLADWIVSQRVNVLAMPSALLRTWLRLLPDDQRFDVLRVIEVATEPLYAADVLHASRHMGQNGTIVNLYGASEVGMISSAAFGPYDVSGSGILPVGVSPPKQGIQVLREDGTPAAQGESGEIVVKTPSMALGYWKDAALTEGVFSRDPSDGQCVYRTGDLGRMNDAGQLLHLGRKDRKIKLRGYSIELQEVENALLRFPGVSDAVVVVLDAAANEKRLVSYIATPEGLSVAGHKALRDFLNSQLPDYMVPSSIVALDALPLTERGKVDRRALPPPDLRAVRDGNVRRPSDRVERALATIWQDVLKLPDIGTDDDFHELGGSSLQAFTILAKIAKRFGRDLPTSTMLTAPTIAEQAKIVRHERPSPSWSEPAPLRLDGCGAPLFIIHAAFGSILFARDIAENMKADRPVFGLQAPPLGALELNSTIESIATQYVNAIRTRQQHGPYFLAGYSFGGWVAFEMAQQLLRQGEAVRFLGLIDPVRSEPAEPEALNHRVSRHLGAVRGRTVSEALGYVAHHVAWKIGIRVARLKVALSRRFPNRGFAQTFGRAPHAYRTVLYQEIFSRATQRYEPQPYTGPAVLFTANGQYEAQSAYWQPLVLGDLMVIEAPVNHKQMIRPPHCSFLAKHIDASLTPASG